MTAALLTDTISLPELIWTVFCTVALVYTMRLLGRARGTLISLRERKVNGIREYAASTRQLLYATLALKQFMFVAIGVILMMLPSPNGKVQPGTWVITGFFLMVSFILALVAWLNDYREQALMKRLQEMDDEAFETAVNEEVGRREEEDN